MTQMNTMPSSELNVPAAENCWMEPWNAGLS